MTFERLFPEVRDLVSELWEHPELGYHEHRTTRRVSQFRQRHRDGAALERFSTTGVKVSLPSAARKDPRRRRIAVVAEPDAVISPAHPDADPATGAVHACGHHTQVGIALSVFAHVVATGAWREADVDLSFVFVPAEACVGLARRGGLREQGEVGRASRRGR